MKKIPKGFTGTNPEADVAAFKDSEGWEFDLHIWCIPEDENMTALYTVSIGKRALCIDMPIDQALEHIREEMESER